MKPSRKLHASITLGALVAAASCGTACKRSPPAPSQQPPSVSAAPASQGAQGERIVAEDGMVRISSDLELTRERWRVGAARLHAAYLHAAAAHGWAVEGRLADPYTVHLLSAELLEKEHPGTNLACFGPDKMFGPVATVMDDPGFADGALVHESTHLLHSRKGRGVLGHYLEEGTAQDLQRLYDTAHSQGKARFVRSMRGETVFLAKVTSDEARPILEQLAWDAKSTKAINRTEDLGCLFVEFLRTRAGGGGYADYVHRIARMVEQMPPLRQKDPGWREAYLAALNREVSPDAEGEFLAYLKKTQGQPSRRLAGTVFEPWLADEVVARRLGSGNESTDE